MDGRWGLRGKCNTALAAGRFLDDEPAIASLCHFKRFTAGYIEGVGAVVLFELGSSLAAFDRDGHVTEFDADSGFTHDAAAPVVFPCFAGLIAGRGEVLAIRSQIGGHILG